VPNWFDVAMTLSVTLLVEVIPGPEVAIRPAMSRTSVEPDESMRNTLARFDVEMSRSVIVVPPTDSDLVQTVLGRVVVVQASAIDGRPLGSVNAVPPGTVTVVLPRVTWMETLVVWAAEIAGNAIRRVSASAVMPAVKASFGVGREIRFRQEGSRFVMGLPGRSTVRIRGHS
jgi:hypothetical protein